MFFGAGYEREYEISKLFEYLKIGDLVGGLNP
jgi:hypothetical protein